MIVILAAMVAYMEMMPDFSFVSWFLGGWHWSQNSYHFQCLAKHASLKRQIKFKFSVKVVCWHILHVKLSRPKKVEGFVGLTICIWFRFVYSMPVKICLIAGLWNLIWQEECRTEKMWSASDWWASICVVRKRSWASFISISVCVGILTAKRIIFSCDTHAESRSFDWFKKRHYL